MGSEIKDSSAQKEVGVDEDSLVLVDTLQPLADGLEGLQPERLRPSHPKHTSLGRMVLLITPPPRAFPWSQGVIPALAPLLLPLPSSPP